MLANAPSCVLTSCASLRRSSRGLRREMSPAKCVDQGKRGVAFQVRAAAGNDAEGGGFLLESIASPFISAKKTLNEGKGRGKTNIEPYLLSSSA